MHDLGHCFDTGAIVEALTVRALDVASRVKSLAGEVYARARMDPFVAAGAVQRNPAGRCEISDHELYYGCLDPGRVEGETR